MMFSHIAPLKAYKVTDEVSGIHLLLYHWAKESKKYVNFFNTSQKYKILDNSFYELRTPVDYNDLLKYAEAMKVQEIVLPDVMYDFKQTRKMIEETLPLIPSKYKTQAVVVGKTLKEYERCVKYYNNIKEIDVIAFSRNGADMFSPSRTNILEYINLININTKPIHLLGAKNIKEMLEPYPSIVRSMDTKLIYKLATNNKKIDLDTNCDNRDLSNFRNFANYINEVQNDRLEKD